MRLSLNRTPEHEFRDRATTYLSGPEPVAVSKHGHGIGLIDLRRTRPE